MTICNYQIWFIVELSVQDVLDIAICKSDDSEPKFEFKEFLAYLDYLVICTSSPVQVPLLKMVEKNEDKYTKSRRLGDNYRAGSMRLYKENIPISFSIPSIRFNNFLKAVNINY